MVGVVCGGLLFHGAGTVWADVLLMGGVVVGLCCVVLALEVGAWLLVAFAGVELALFGFATGGWYKNKEAGATCVAPAPSKGRLPTLPLSQYHRRGEA